MRTSIYATDTDVAGNISVKSAAVGIVLNVTPSVIYSYVTDKTAYTVSAGGTITVEVFLKETLIGGATSLIAADGGLFGAGFSVARASGSAALGGIAGSVVSNGSNFAGGGFAAKPGASASFMAGADYVGISATQGAMPNAKDSNGITDLIEIGTVTISAATAGISNFTLANFRAPASAGGYTQTFNTGYDLDLNGAAGGFAFTGASANPDTFTVTVN